MTSPRRSEELIAFQAWLQSLSWQRLREASTIAYPCDPQTHKNTELDLLHEMLDLQPPPPTPIHARAIPYRPVAARDLCTDGRNQDERNFRGRFQRPCWFQWVERESRRLTGKKRSVVTQYDVFQKRFVQPDGAVYTLGCTQQQRDADEELLRLCVFVESVTESATYIQLDGRSDPRHVIRLLRVASRGGFASAPPSKTNSQSPWLDPSQRWFSLPMFLASRLELALWKSYREAAPPVHPWPRTLSKELSSTQITSIVSQVAVQFWKQQLEKTHEHITTLMDTVLWKLLVDRQGNCSLHLGESSSLSSQSLLESLVRFPLVSPFNSKLIREFRQEARNALYREFCTATERSLMSDPPSSPEARKNTSSSKKSKRRNKQKKTSKTIPTVMQDDEINFGSDRSQASQEEAILPRHEEKDCGCHIEYPDNGTSARDRNRNIVTALDVVDTILNRVFVKVGLEPDPDVFEVDKGTLVVRPSEETVGETEEKSELEDKTIEPLDETCTIEDSNVSPGNNVNVILVSELLPKIESPSPRFKEYPSSAFQRFDPPISTIGLSQRVVDDWSKQNGFAHREESLLEDFFQSQKDAASREQQVEASSTAASLASSCMDMDQRIETADSKEIASEASHEDVREALSIEIVKGTTEEDETEKVGSHGHLEDDADLFAQESELPESPQPTLDPLIDQVEDVEDQSLSPPSTPSPRLSPILITLSDISRIQKESLKSTKPADATQISVHSASARSISAKSEPKPALTKVTSSRSIDCVRNPGYRDIEKKVAPLSPSLGHSHQTFTQFNRSRDDQDIRNKGNLRKTVDVLASYRNVVLRPVTARDDHDIGRIRTGPKSLSYRAAVAKAPARSVSYSKTAEAPRFPFSHFQIDAGWWKGKTAKKSGAQSDTTFDIHDDYQNWPDLRQSQGQEDGDNTKDGSTTITSVFSNREAEDVSVLREERDAYRDMCLTLGAEVAKLKNVLAAQKSLLTSKPTPTHGPLGVASGPFDPHMFGTHSFERFPFPRSHTAMSDAGFRIDYESQASEDDAVARLAYTVNSRQLSSVATHFDSDVSIDCTSTNVTQAAIAVPVISRYGTEPSYFQGMRSRLTIDMLRFLQSTDIHLKRQEPIKAAAIERMTRLVNTMWPRAQVKLYGSNVTGLSLPTSDLDFVICLPAVHKKAVAVAPGVLEGRNAINESSQKLLARTLKGESWIDPRSMKLIERTVVPVIKVSTKDTKARSLQLDITFDSPGHHGIEAIQMVTQIMDELPVIRPLLLVLKQFLSNRGLLTAYTGGLSAYGLFLMVARYLQEQESWGDCGSLLMGFLDFYGNNVSHISFCCSYNWSSLTANVF